MISTLALASLLLMLGSLVDDALTLRNPPSPPKACIATVAVASPPGLMLPRVKSMVPAPGVHVPWVVVAEKGEPSEPY